MCLALGIGVCFGTLSCCREGPGVRLHVGVMSCRTRICVTKSGRNIFPLHEYYSNAICTYCILCMLLWIQIFCGIYVVYLPSSCILDNAGYCTKLLVNSEYRGSNYCFIKSLPAESNGKLPQEPAQDAVCQSHSGHMTGLWFLPAQPLRLNTNEWMMKVTSLFRE